MLQRPPNATSPTYFEGETFNKIGLENPPQKGEYENCLFTGCNLTSADLSHFQFIDCVFKDCNLSNAKLVQTAFRGVQFIGCKMMGLHFHNCNDFLMAVSFDGCVLSLCSFYKLKLRKTTFKDSTLHEADFTETDVSGSTFSNCDLAKAIFDNTLLEKADFRTAYHYTIDPQTNRLKKARFSKDGLEGLLQKFDIIIS